MKKNNVSSDPHMNRYMVLSRYMNLPKFVDLLRSSELYLASAVNFDDNLEGTLPELMRDHIIESDILKKKLGLNNSIEEVEYQNKLQTNLSCWTIGSRDNMALWKIYGGDEHSVRISTTFERLLFSASKWRDFGRITFKKVQYVDLGGKLPDGIYTIDEHIFGIKHKAYEYEHEVRIVVTRTDQTFPSELRLPVNLNYILIKVTVAPNAGEWFHKVVNDLLVKYNISRQAEKSGLYKLIKRAKTNKPV